MDVLPIILGLGGFVILYGAVRNKRPDDIVRLALQGKDINGARPLAAPLIPPVPAGAVPSTSLPGTPQAGDDARTDPPGFQPGPNTYVVPILPGEGSQNGGGVL